MSHKVTPFDGFVDMNVESLLRTAYLLSGDVQASEDLVQECLLKVAQRWSRVQDMDEPLAFARRVLVNQTLRGSKQRSRHRAELGIAQPETGAWLSALDAVADREQLRAALRQLTPRQRAVIVLRYYHDLTEAQVADALGCATGTVKSTTAKSLLRLRELIGPAGAPVGGDRS